MNKHNRYFRRKLPSCPKCTMDSGKRMVSLTNPERYFVVCEACGFQTKGHPNQSAATREWSDGSREKEEDM